MIKLAGLGALPLEVSWGSFVREKLEEYVGKETYFSRASLNITRPHKLYITR